MNVRVFFPIRVRIGQELRLKKIVKTASVVTERVARTFALFIE